MADEKKDDFKLENHNPPAGYSVPLYDVAGFIEPSSLPGKPEESNPEYSMVSTAMMSRENIYSEAVTATKRGSPNKDKTRADKKFVCLVVTVVSILLLMMVFGCLIVTVFREIAKLESQIASSQQTSIELSRNDSGIMIRLQQIVSHANYRLDEIESSEILQLNTSITEQLIHLSDVSRQINASVGERFREFEDIKNIQDSKIRQLNMSVKCLVYC